MKLFKTRAGEYLGFYSEYGGSVKETGSRGSKPIYSFIEARDDYRLLEHTRAPSDLPAGQSTLDELVLSFTATEERFSVLAEFIGVAKSVGPNAYVV